MKKFIIAGLSVMLLVGCGTLKEKQEVEPKKEEQVVNAGQKSKYLFPEGANPIGEGKVKVVTPDGTSENGNVPTVFVRKDTLIQKVEIELANFQGDKETFVYVDHIFEDTYQVSRSTQTTVELKQETLEQGNHTVTAIQFENNDPNGKVVNFVQAKFENKPAL
ncbi:hypothetical protein QUF99_14485 [Bacillus sp. DX4.1]|uniref:hypothetical protein n=1 Tax=Bacillus sp. DX4.1 TaxID=3055867 RepID=UPI0025A2884C|nr:hypothetical protein [Bacillus sp. DX4.1]MDM5188480.1 hypothetical protein [Bacillus sp. DX4.1]